MERTQATKLLRDLLNENGLAAWHIRLHADVTARYLGLCDYKEKCIVLNSHHVDTHPDNEIINTIRHEVAHALCSPMDGHNEVWKQKALELGCKDTSPCASFSLDAKAIDAIRSGHQLEVKFNYGVTSVEYKVKKFVKKCPVCGKDAKVKTQVEVDTSKGRKKVITYECLHVVFEDSDSQSPFEKIIFDGDSFCNHQWDKTTCTKCQAHKLYPFQIEGARELERNNGRMAILDEPGLGKTIQALAYLKYHEEDGWPFLWVTKSGIKFQHGTEIIRILGKKAIPQVLRTGRDSLLPGMNVIASYDIFRRLKREIFTQHGFKTIVIDECQAIKNPDSQRTNEIRNVAREIPKIIPLSGTHWKNRGSESFVIFNMLDAARFSSYQGFKNRWVATYWDKGKEKEGGIRNPVAFREYASGLFIRRERQEVMPELPLINRTKLNCELDAASEAVYNEEEDKLVKMLNDMAIDGQEHLTFEQQAKVNQSIMVMKQIVGIAKVPTTVDFVQEFMEETERKLVVFVHHKKCGELISEQMKIWCAENSQPQPLVLTASLTPEERFAVAEKFNGPNHRLLIASTLASGEGLNLQTCSDCVMHERQWNPANEEQAEGRFIRIGQMAQSITAVYVHANVDVDLILDGIVEGKRIRFHNSMNKGEMAQWNESSIASEFLDKLRMKKRKR